HTCDRRWTGTHDLPLRRPTQPRAERRTGRRVRPSRAARGRPTPRKAKRRRARRKAAVRKPARLRAPPVAPSTRRGNSVARQLLQAPSADPRPRPIRRPPRARAPVLRPNTRVALSHPLRVTDGASERGRAALSVRTARAARADRLSTRAPGACYRG